jgi:enoyl-CoA hydratase/3-hydroxyacyl-CoA dehydrogenase
MGFKLSSHNVNQIAVAGLEGAGADLVAFFALQLFRYDVQLTAITKNPALLEKSTAYLSKKIDAAIAKKAARAEQKDSIIMNVIFTTDIGSVEEADLVFEMSESEDEKKDVLSEITNFIKSRAVLASHSPYLSPDALAGGLSHPDRFAVVHHLLPSDRNSVVEIVPHAKTDPDVTRFLEAFYETLGKAPQEVGPQFGHAVSPIAWGLFQAALALTDELSASTQQIDAIAAKALRARGGIAGIVQSCGGFESAKEGYKACMEGEIDFLKSPCLLEAQIWKPAGKDEEVTCPDDMAEKAGDVLTGALCALSAKMAADERATVGQIEEMVQIGLGITPPFSLMNKLKAEKTGACVDRYLAVNPDLAMPAALADFIRSGKGWHVPYVIREDRDGVAQVTIRRPRVLNALNADVLDQLDEIFEAIAADDTVKAVVLSGFGNKAFVAGADIQELARMQSPDDGYRVARKGQKIFSKIENLAKPVVCAMNGLAFGGGNELAMSCHVRLASRGLKVFVSQPEPKLGLIPGYGGTQRLPRLIGMEKAWELLRSGGLISSSQAKEYGLIRDEVDGSVKEAALDLAKKLADGRETYQPIEKNPLPQPSALPDVSLGHLSTKIDQIIMDAIRQGAATTLEEGLDLEAKGFGECLNTKDTRIGLENFIKNGPRVNADFVNE